jgi:DNA-binding NarL/FixJ family response regulator
MLSMYEGEELISLAMDAGACGYLLKRASLEEIHSTIQPVARGGSVALGG